MTNAVSSKALPRTLFALLAILLMGASAAGAWWLRARWHQPPDSAAGGMSLAAADHSRRGEVLFRANCQACHGPDGHGDGAAAVGMVPPPRDFAVAPWKFGATETAVRRVIRDGSPGTAMPGFASLPENDRGALTAFVLALAPPTAMETPPVPAPLAKRLRGLGFTPEERPTFAPDLSLRDLDGRALALDHWRGKVVLLNFWGTSCVHCLKELPELEQLASDVGEGFAVVSVCFDENDTAAVRRLVQGRVDALPICVNPDGMARARYDVQAMPSFFLIDPFGRLVSHAAGARLCSAAALRELVLAMKD